MTIKQIKNKLLNIQKIIDELCFQVEEESRRSGFYGVNELVELVDYLNIDVIDLCLDEEYF